MRKIVLASQRRRRQTRIASTMMVKANIHLNSSPLSAKVYYWAEEKPRKIDKQQPQLVLSAPRWRWWRRSMCTAPGDRAEATCSCRAQSPGYEGRAALAKLRFNILRGGAMGSGMQQICPLKDTIFRIFTTLLLCINQLQRSGIFKTKGRRLFHRLLWWWSGH